MRNLVALVVGALVLAGCGSSAFTSSGKVGIVAVDGGNEDCSSGAGGYDDIRGGASVVIYDASGKRVALGSLDKGKDAGGFCTFDFTVEGVPSGAGPYGVEVASRGQVAFNEDDADSIVLTLG